MKSRNLKIILISIFCILEYCTIFYVYRDYFQDTEKDYINEELKETIKLNNLAIMISDGTGNYVESGNDTLPTSGYVYNKELSGCIDADGKIIENSLSVKNGKISVVVDSTSYCYVYYDIIPRNLSETVMALAGTSGSNVYNEGNAGYRYEGASVNNYITFNDETWRIVGVEEGSSIGLNAGKYYTKIIKDSFFTLMYDTDGIHANSWNTTSLFLIINGDYYNKTGNYVMNGINADARKLIVDANWYFTPADGSGHFEFTSEDYYTNERSDSTKFVRDAVGIMYPSDFGYASTQSECQSVKLNNYNEGCYQKNWLYNGETQWTIMPYKTDTSHAIAVSNYAGMESAVTNRHVVRPVVYLNYDVSIRNNGDGSSTNKYFISR